MRVIFLFAFQMSSQSIAETVQIKCRYCQIKLYRKNYKSHIESAHPDKDKSDLTPADQPRLTSFLKKKAPPVIPPDHDDWKKRRHESGESIDSGFATDLMIGDTDKDTNVDRVTDNVTINIVTDAGETERDTSNVNALTVDAKLDMILKEMKDIGKRLPERLAVRNDTKDTFEESEGDIGSNENVKNLKLSRSLEEILEAGFAYDEGNEIVSCCVCPDTSERGQFFYDKEIGVQFSESNMPREFRNLKSSVLRHITTSKSHLEVLAEKDLKLQAEAELTRKNKVIGMNLGRLCMKNYLLGRPYTDYEYDVLVLKKAGGEVGELNHSRHFPAFFRPFVANVVHKRVTDYLKTPLKQTGHRPPVCISADKGTYKHRSRQFLGVVTIVPGGDEWLVPLSCGQPVVTEGSSGSQLAKNMKTGFDSFELEACQVESAVFDGVYFHCSVEDHLGGLYNFETGQVLYTYDALHKAGLVDKHMAKEEGLKWLGDHTSICTQIFNTFNWGANYEKFRDEIATWKLNQTNLVNFSETRFANSKRKVFKNIHYQFGPIITCLEDQIKAGEDNRKNLEAANTDIRKKADKAKELVGKILNLEFLLLLAGLADIYEKYGHIIQVTQMVHLLPHERLDLYNKALEGLKNMAHTLDHKNCEQFLPPGASIKCLWPLSHEDKATYKQEGTIRNLKISSQHGIQAAGLQVRTRGQTGEVVARKGEDILKVTDEKLLKVVRELATGLTAEVYSSEGKAAVELTRTILDLPDLARKVKASGSSSIKVAITEFPKFLNNVRSLPIVTLRDVSDEELKSEFRTFVARLEELTKEQTVADLVEIDPKELIKKFFDPRGELYVGIEMILQV